MARKVLGPTRSRRRRWLLLMCLAVSAGVAVITIPSALAVSVKSLTFELDGNVVQDDTTTPKYDWANFFDASGGRITPLPSGFGASSFVRDFKTKTNGSFDTSDTSTYTVGSKDIQNVSGWSCTPANNVTDKGDIMNAYVTQYTDPSSGDKIMYFALERNANAGDANVAFWFLQGSASCPAAGGSFVGNHHDGDLLIVSAFTKGGVVSTIDAYRWNGGANGSLGTTPVAHGVDCTSATASADPTCATSNTGAITTPWQTENKTDGVGHTLESGEFFEGGLDLTPIGLANDCFNTFLTDTRSSQSLTATLYDYALGTLGECKTNLSTQSGDVTHTPENGGTPAASPSSIGGGSASSGTDTAALQVTGISSWSGTLTFYICGPLASFPTSGPACRDSGGNEIGVPAGSVNVSETDNAVHYFLSGTATLTSAGKYCWTSHFEPSTASAGNGVQPADDSAATECFTVAKANPAINTCSGTFNAATPPVCTPSGAVAFGNAVHDYGSVSGLATEPGSGGADTNFPTINPTTLGAYAGSISFELDHAGTSACGSRATGTGTNPQTTPSTGAGSVASTGNGIYGPFNFTPDTPGDYYWQATISNASSVNNTLPASDDTSCNETNEKVTVQQIPTSISTTQKVYPQDSATIASTGPTSDLLPAGGTVTFYLYDNSADCLAHGTTVGSGGLLYKEAATTTASHSETLSTSNTSVAVNTNTTVYWRVTYATGDTAHTGIQSDCAENTQTTFTNDSGPGTAFTP